MKLPRDYRKIHIDGFNASQMPRLTGSVRLKVVFLSLFLLVGLVFTQLVFANSLATDGEKLARVQKEIKRLERENISLKAEIAHNSALTNLAQSAKNSGFTKPKTITIIDKF